MSLEVWFALVVVFFNGGLLPGPAVMLVLSSAFQHGFRTAMLAALGVASANVFWLLLAVSGAATLALQFPKGFLGLKVLGLLVIIYMAVTSMRGPLPNVETDGQSAPPRRRLYTKGFTLQISSPLPLIYFGIILPTFVDTSRDIWTQFWIMLATVTATELIGLAAYAYGAERIRRFLRNPTNARRFNMFIGVTMIVSGFAAIYLTWGKENELKTQLINSGQQILANTDFSWAILSTAAH